MNVFLIFSTVKASDLTPNMKYTEAPGIKLPASEANYSSPSGADVKNTWSETSIPPLLHHDLVLNLI
jgi:hypothetical protein